MSDRNLSPEASQKQYQQQRDWHAKNYERISFAVQKGERDRYKAVAAKRGKSLSRWIIDLMEADASKQ